MRRICFNTPTSIERLTVSDIDTSRSHRKEPGGFGDEWVCFGVFFDVKGRLFFAILCKSESLICRFFHYQATRLSILKWPKHQLSNSVARG